MSKVVDVPIWLDNASDWLNPLLVKEVRQIVRGREFNYSFSLSLLAGLIVAFLGGADALNGADGSGSWVFSGLITCLSILGLVIVPLGTFAALRGERAERTLDLITLTTLSPRRIVIGKLLAQSVKLVTLFAGLAPFIAMSFLLGGIDLLTILMSLVSLFIWSLWACSAALFFSSISKSRAMSVIIYGAVGMGLFVLFVLGRFALPSLFVVSGFSAVGSPSFLVSRLSAWWTLAVSVSVCAVTMINLILLAEHRISLPTQIRLAPLRAMLFVQFLVFVAWPTVPVFFHATGVVKTDVIPFIGVLGGIQLAIVALFAVTEQVNPPPQESRRSRGSFEWAWSLFRPGRGRGPAYVLAQMAILLGLVWLMDPPGEWLRWTAAICGYVCFFTGAPVLIGKRIARVRKRAAYLRVAALLTLPLVMLLPDVLNYIVNSPEIFDVEFSLRHVVNPFRTLINWQAVERLHWTPYVFGLGVVGLICYALLIISARESQPEKGHANAAH